MTTLAQSIEMMKRRLRQMSDTLSLYGMYEYDNTLLDNLVLPSSLDRDTIINNLLVETAELEVLYSDIDMLKATIGFWSKKQLPIWEHMLETTQYEYNPIWNKDGTITEVETRDLSNKGKGTNVSNPATTSTHDVAGFNNANSSEKTYSYSDTMSGSNKDTNDYEEANTGTIKHERKEQGNIGVTSTQYLIEEERRIAEFNIIDYIITDFIKRFCLLVY